MLLLLLSCCHALIAMLLSLQSHCCCPCCPSIAAFSSPLITIFSSLLSHCHAILLLFPIPLPYSSSSLSFSHHIHIFNSHSHSTPSKFPSHSSSSSAPVSDLLLLNALSLAMSPAQFYMLHLMPNSSLHPSLTTQSISSLLHYSTLYHTFLCSISCCPKPFLSP